MKCPECGSEDLYHDRPRRGFSVSLGVAYDLDRRGLYRLGGTWRYSVETNPVHTWQSR
jgi:hypothetical protein